MYERDVGGEVVDAYCIVQRDILVMCPALREWAGASMGLAPVNAALIHAL
jgi:hypothetical protein